MSRGETIMKRILFLTLLVAVLASVIALASEIEVLKIAVASTGKTVDSPVSDKAARSPYYLLFDGSGALIKIIENPHKTTERGAGPKAAQFLAREGVNTVIAQTVGGKMANTLKSNGIAYYERTGKAEDVVKEVLKRK